MTQFSSHLSSLQATILTLNLMIGGGLFVNMVLLAHYAGTASPLVYCVVGLLIFPLMLSFAHLAAVYPGGTLRTYASTLGPQIAILHTATYVLAKLASCAVTLSVSATMLLSLFSIQETALIQALAYMLLGSWVIIIYRYGPGTQHIQRLFLCGKLFPILFIIISGVILPAVPPVLLPTSSWNGFIQAIPLVLYAFMGFEASSGFYKLLTTATYNAKKSLLLACMVGIIGTVLFQTSLIRVVPLLGNLNGYQAVFPTLLMQWNISAHYARLLTLFFHGCIAISASGVAFTILYANIGTLIDLLPQNARWASYLCRPNKYGIAGRIVMLELLCVGFYLVYAPYALSLLQRIAAAGVTTTYVVCICALALYEQRNKKHISVVTVLSIFAALLLCGTCLKTIYCACINHQT